MIVCTLCLQGFCQYICRNDAKCEIGSGPCRGDNNACVTGEVVPNACGSQGSCLNTWHFPLDQYPDQATKYISSDHCCTRYCHRLTMPQSRPCPLFIFDHRENHRCTLGQFGCVVDSDCAIGLRCGADGKCEDTFCSVYMKQRTGAAWEYHDGICYKYYSTTRYRTDASNFCKGKGAELADVSTEDIYVRSI